MCVLPTRMFLSLTDKTFKHHNRRFLYILSMEEIQLHFPEIIFEKPMAEVQM